MIAKQKELKDAIKEAVEATGQESITADRVNVKRYTTNKISYPTKLIEEHVPENLLLKIQQVTTVENIRITVAKK